MAITNLPGGKMLVRIIQRRLTLLPPVTIMFFTAGGGALAEGMDQKVLASVI